MDGMTMGQCPNCEKILNIGWVVCLHCGWRVTTAINSKLPSLEIAKQSACSSCRNNCSNENSKPKKSKCCKRYL